MNRPNLNYLSHAYRKAETAEGRVSLPDGEYSAQIVKAEVKQSDDGKLRVAWTLSVSLPDGDTAQTTKTSFLSEAAMPMFKRDLKMLDIDPAVLEPSFDRLHAVLDYLQGTVVDFEQRTTTKNDRTYTNINFLRVTVPSSNPPPTFEDEIPINFEQVQDDELPF